MQLSKSISIFYIEIDHRKLSHMMLNKKVQIYILLLILIFSLYQGLKNSQQKKVWTYYLANNILNKNGTLTILDLEHLHGDQLPKNLTLEIQKRNGEKSYNQISNASPMNITSTILMAKQSIKKTILHSPQKLSLKHKGRILLETEEAEGTLRIIAKVLGNFFAALRNVTILAVITNSLDLWMPLLMFVESLLSYGLWTHNPYIIGEMLKIAFNSKIDVFNLIRMSFSSDFTPIKFQTIQQYGFTNSFMLNVSGEYLLLLFLAIATAIIKISNVFIKSEKLRNINSKLRSIWNGYVFWLIPRSLIFAGYQLRSVETDSEISVIINCILSAIVIIGFIIYSAFMIVQVRKINLKLEYIEESRLEIGLARRLDYLRDFEFDCLQYSILYYPAMNSIRLTFGFLCSGFAPDFHYVQYGGPLAGQIFFMMIQISCSGYTRFRDKIVYPFINFLYIIYILSYLTAGLVNEVGYLQLTLQLQVVAFTMLLSMISIILVSILIDTIQQCQQSWGQQKSVTERDLNQVRSSTTNRKRKHHQCKAEDLNEKEDNEDQQQNENPKGKNIQNRMKVKKIRKGKVI